jgi:hypothetical protein
MANSNSRSCCILCSLYLGINIPPTQRLNVRVLIPVTNRSDIHYEAKKLMPPAATFLYPFSRPFPVAMLSTCFAASFFFCSGVHLFTVYPVILVYNRPSPCSVVRLCWSSCSVSFPIFIPHDPLVVVVEVVETLDKCRFTVTMEFAILLVAFSLYDFCSREVVYFVCVHRFFFLLRPGHIPLSALLRCVSLSPNLTSSWHL